jgi:fatty acid desaturase
MPSDADAQFQRLLDRLKRRAPRTGAFLDWVRRPSSRLVRIPLALLLILAGFAGFLPLLGFWMLPLGLIILALDVSILRPVVTRSAIWVERKWKNWKARRRARSQR